MHILLEYLRIRQPNYDLYSTLYKPPNWGVIQPFDCIIPYILHAVIILSPPKGDKQGDKNNLQTC